jgi:uncharacterized protein (DUF433 family)
MLSHEKMEADMSTPAKAKDYPHIIIDPDVSGGQPVVEGTRIPVTTIVRSHQLGMDFDEILVQFPALKPEQLHAALAYYLDHQEELDALLERHRDRAAGAVEVTV